MQRRSGDRLDLLDAVAGGVLKQLEGAALSAEEKAAIGGGNAARLLGLQPAG